MKIIRGDYMRSGCSGLRLYPGWWVVAVWLLVGYGAQSGPLVSTESPIGFFTNVASRLLKSELNLDLNRIQLYPTNQYTPSAHRLLQVTANLYDTLTNRTLTDYPFLPTVFRPLFTNDGGRIYISGYAEETGTAVLNAPVRDLQSVAGRAALAATDMVSGVPLVIGARKGFPNFNKFMMQTGVQVTRKLQFHRPGTSNTQPVNEIDQMFVVSITNAFGLEAWNSYVTNFPRPLRVVVVPDLMVTLTNSETGKFLNPQTCSFSGIVATNIGAGSWAGYNAANEGVSFVLPLSAGAGVPYTSFLSLPNSTYQFSADSLVPLTGNFERAPGTTNFYIPRWQLTVRSRLRFAMIDATLGVERIVDDVNLDSTEPVVDISSALQAFGECGDIYTPNGTRASMWCTNRLVAGGDPSVATYGIRNQIEASLGHTTVDWNTSANEFPAGMTKDQAISFFRGQFLPGYPLLSNTFNAPFQPYRRLYVVTSWQANDPLVHHTISDLVEPPASFSSLNPVQWDVPDQSLDYTLGHINRRYQPWAGNPKMVTDATSYDPTLKDPFVRNSDNWNFPTNPSPDLSWLGRVHRGTPWQTFYLKSSGPDLTSWVQWSGDTQMITNQSGVFADAVYTQPTNDWHVVSLLISLLNTNDSRNSPSVNQADVPTWCGLLNGMSVLSNSLPDDAVPFYWLPQLDSLVMSSNSPQAGTIAAALVAARQAQPGHYLHNLGDILATSELSLASPWMNCSPIQLQYGISEEAFEAIPSQLLPLLRADSIASCRLVADGLQLEFTGIEGLAYEVQSSPDLANWVSVSTNYPVNGSFSFVASLPSFPARRFYRAMLQP